jgi:hypothetical protein
MSENKWLDTAVLEYIQNNSGKIDKFDVISHFKSLTCDLPLMSITRLEDQGRIQFRSRGLIYFIK